MARAQHDGEREREEYQQDEERNRDAEATARLGRVDRGQRRRRLDRLAATVAVEHALFVEPERTRVRAQKAAHEHVGGKLLVRVVLEVLQHAHGHARRLRQLGERDLPELALSLQVGSQ